MNEKEWLLKSSHIPRGWIVGWNKQGDIRNKTLYEIRATLTMYLLGKQKKVIPKDASLEQTIQYLSIVIPNQLSKVKLIAVSNYEKQAKCIIESVKESLSEPVDKNIILYYWSGFGSDNNHLRHSVPVHIPSDRRL